MRKKEGGPAAHDEAFSNTNSTPLEIGHLVDEAFRIDDHAPADPAAYIGTNRPGRKEMKGEPFLAEANRMARVRAALEANGPRRVGGEDIDDLALPLVPPLRADED